MSKDEPPSYSELLTQISSGEVESLELIPARREVIVRFKDGSKSKVPIFSNNQQILRTAEFSGTPLSVRNIRNEQLIAGMAGNLAVILMILMGLGFLLRRSAKIASKTIGFGRSQTKSKAIENLDVRFEDVAGLDEAKQELKELVTFLKEPETFTKLGARIPKGCLLVGPPGTGKTLLAKAIAGESGVPFFSLAASEFVELFVGVGASRVRDLFRQAKEKSPCIIFIDEIDSVGRQRGAGIGGGNDEREQTLNQLLTEMDGFQENSGIILLAATNRADILDQALLRPGRFDRQIYVTLPDRKGRAQILSVHARKRPLEESVSLDSWAIRTPGFTGAELENMLNEASIITARTELTKIGDKQIEYALERITMGLSSAPLQDSSKKRLIAYHEVGHALVAALTPKSNKIDKISLLPKTSGIGGYTRFWPNEETIDSGLSTKSNMYAQLVVSLGGRAAELVIFGPSEVTQGASGDLEAVTYLAREMVTKFGFSKLGPIAFDTMDKEVFLGKSLFEKKSGFSEVTGKAIDKEVRGLANNALNEAISILEPQRKTMDKIVNVLIDEETIDSERFYKLAGLKNPFV